MLQSTGTQLLFKQDQTLGDYFWVQQLELVVELGTGTCPFPKEPIKNWYSVKNVVKYTVIRTNKHHSTKSSDNMVSTLQ